jgi:homoserine kinase type II
VTDATKADENDLLEAAEIFGLTAKAGGEANVAFARTSRGVNNKCAYCTLTLPDGSTEQYVVRVYNNGFNRPRVAYEHAVLKAVRAALEGRVDFETPRLVPTAKDSSATFATLSSGTEACVFHLIRGGPAGLPHARVIGRATAQLVVGMSAIPPPAVDKLPNPLYRNIYDAHHKMTRPLFLETMASSEFDHVRANADFLVFEVLKAEGLVASILALSPPLPEQLIHADAHSDNLLQEDGAITGILDFEFAAPDWRIMEAAVSISKYIAVSGAEEAFEQWVVGYKEGQGPMTAKEAELLPDLITLRVLSNVVYFAGRAAAKEDTFECLSTRCELYATRIRWIDSHKQWMIDTLTKHLL